MNQTDKYENDLKDGRIDVKEKKEAAKKRKEKKHKENEKLKRKNSISIWRLTTNIIATQLRNAIDQIPIWFFVSGADCDHQRKFMSEILPKMAQIMQKRDKRPTWQQPHTFHDPIIHRIVHNFNEIPVINSRKFSIFQSNRRRKKTTHLVSSSYLYFAFWVAHRRTWWNLLISCVRLSQNHTEFNGHPKIE